MSVSYAIVVFPIYVQFRVSPETSCMQVLENLYIVKSVNVFL